jgi:hypothetical protein
MLYCFHGAAPEKKKCHNQKKSVVTGKKMPKKEKKGSIEGK